MSTELTLTEKSAISTYVSRAGHVRKIRGNGDDPPWGKANPLRGKGGDGHYHDLACLFIQKYPVGTRLNQDAFCDWAEKTLHSEEFSEWARSHDVFVNVPAVGTPKNSDAWHAHLSRRHRLRFNINKAATHPRMAEVGLIAFKIASDGPNILEVRLPPVELVRHDDSERTRQRLLRKQRQYDYLMQASNWNDLDARTVSLVERVYDQIGDYIDTMETAEYRLNRDCMRADEALKAIGIGVPPVALEGSDADEPEEANGDFSAK